MKPSAILLLALKTHPPSAEYTSLTVYDTRKHMHIDRERKKKKERERQRESNDLFNTVEGKHTASEMKDGAIKVME